MNRGLRALLGYLWKYRQLVLPGMLALSVSDGGQLVVPLVIKSTVDTLSGTHANRHLLTVNCFAILALTALIVAARFIWRHFLFSAARLAEVDLRRRLLAHVLSLPASYYSKTRTGEVMALATNDVLAVRMALAMGMVAMFDSTIFAVVALVAMATLNWRLTLWTALPFPLLFVVMSVSLRWIYQRWDSVQSSFERLTEKVRESLSGMRVLRAYVQEEGDRRDFEIHNQDYYRHQTAYVRVDGLFQPAILVLAGMSTAILLAVGGRQVIYGETSLGSFAAFSSYLAMLSWPMIAAGWMLTLTQRGAASMARILDMLAQPAEEDDAAAVVSADGATVEARGLSFTYVEGATPVLQDLSFRVPPGGTLGLVGEVGSGKSTLAMLLLRIYNPPPATLFLDGVDVNDYPLGQLRSRIAWVPQESFLFSDTIEDNLLLGDPTANLDRLRDICGFATIDAEIMEFPAGYATMLGERGVTLSGGQKQRLSLARALLKEAPVLVLDDTLSAVDADAERRILQQLRQRVQGRTALVISHRISAVRDLDWILVLHRGQVVQQGTHAELIGQSGFYRELYELQELEAAQA